VDFDLEDILSGEDYKEIYQTIIDDIKQNFDKWKIQPEGILTVVKHNSGKKHYKEGFDKDKWEEIEKLLDLKSKIKQGIEILVFDDVKKHISKDHDFIAVLSGLSIQLYRMNKKSCEMINGQHGINIERRTFAPFIFLGFNSISSATSHDPCFKLRKRILISSIKNNIERLHQVSHQEVTNLIKKYKLKSNLNILEILNEYVENVTSEFMWGYNIISKYHIDFSDKDYKLKNLSIIQALNQALHDVYTYKYSNLLYIPITKESRRILNNIAQIRKSFKEMTRDLIDNFSGKSLIKDMVDKNFQLEEKLYDDIIITTSSGLNIVKLMIMSIIWHLYEEKNRKWRNILYDEVKILNKDGFDYTKLASLSNFNAFISEVIRYESSFSFLNNYTIKDFEMVIGEKVYKFKKGTYITSNVYAIHHKKDSLLKFDPSRFLNKNDDLCFIPFGIGGRSCPGKLIGLSM
ncbi:16020_t:CDS:2, partial [Dentiscutata erythropus]